MRGNLTNQSTVETLTFGEVQSPFNLKMDQKNPIINVSANVYYGYQLLTKAQDDTEPMHCDVQSRSKSCVEMEVSNNEYTFNMRKRVRDYSEAHYPICKKRRQNEVPKYSQRCSLNKALLEEELLQETHGCSYYHWVASNI
ncbi:uncharacterized protein LOC143204542 [Rhynchophorus ferrugineus]|uniref:Uncharacterized protein n=1 Tax=Rhynchophorus ferrugineus TaxID=354439 RepID=A0A834M7P9_RHYFE|nr:hypothetical protein GWI33_018741 [Rhynchophorus ferrugineus]